jgi:hypothetical protein
MKKSLLMLAAMGCMAASAAQASPIPFLSPGGSLLGVTVSGQASVYDIFGHAGNPGGDYGPDAPAVLTTFGAGSGNVFNFLATGLVSCCSNTPDIPPDGNGGGMNVGGANGLSGLSGNQHIPLVGVFTTSVDPFGGIAPSALSFDVNNPLSLSPLLDQVFYIGDGLSGYNNALGSSLFFTAPTNATQLYLGAIDALGFGGQTGYYNDNHGSFSVDIHLSGRSTAIPEPSSWAVMLSGLGALGLFLRGRRRRNAA